MTLNHFLLQRQVISLYRKLMNVQKVCKLIILNKQKKETLKWELLVTCILLLLLLLGLNKGDAKELRDWIRTNFEKYRHERDLDKIKNLITSGQHQMHTLQGSVSLAQTSRS
ncbi:unnamed protein product [Cunninghamella echinulata]